MRDWLDWRGAGEDSPRAGRVREEYIRKIILGGECCLAFGGAFANVGVVLETGGFGKPPDRGHLAAVDGTLALVGGGGLGGGLQNSLSTNYEGMILRTTHLTGLVTDCGSALGMRLRGYHVPPRLFLVPGLLGFSFLAGGICSGLMFFRLPFDVVTFAGCAYLAAGIGWSVAKRSWLSR